MYLLYNVQSYLKAVGYVRISGVIQKKTIAGVKQIVF